MFTIAKADGFIFDEAKARHRYSKQNRIPFQYNIMFRSLGSRNALFFIAGFGAAFSVITIWRWIESNRQQQTRNSSRKRVVAFGDSITQHGFNNDISGWVSRLADWWTRRVDLLNRGFSGYNSEYGVIAFKTVVVAENPDLIFIFYGANDAVDSSNDRHVSLTKFERNLWLILNECRQVVRVMIVHRAFLF